MRQRALPVRECTRRAKRVHKGSRGTLWVRVRARTVHNEGVIGGTVCKGGVRLRTVRKGSVSKEYYP